MNSFKYVSEYGTSEPIRFLNPDQVRTYDDKGNEMIIPKCDKCKCFKSLLIGQTQSAWVCNSCGGQ